MLDEERPTEPQEEAQGAVSQISFARCPKGDHYWNLTTRRAVKDLAKIAELGKQDGATRDTSAALPVRACPKHSAPESRQTRWARLVEEAQQAFSDLSTARDRCLEALSELNDLKSEFEEWKDNMSENLQGSATYEKLEEVCELDLEPEEDDLAAIEEAISGAEGADLPLGYGRD